MPIKRCIKLVSMLPKQNLKCTEPWLLFILYECRNQRIFTHLTSSVMSQQQTSFIREKNKLKDRILICLILVINSELFTSIRTQSKKSVLWIYLRPRSVINQQPSGVKITIQKRFTRPSSCQSFIFQP